MYERNRKKSIVPLFLICSLCVSWSYGSLIDTYSAKYGVDPLLVEAVIAKESSGRAKVAGIDANKKGYSYGLMQIKYGTAVDEGYRGKLSGLYKPSINIKYGVKYIAKCIEWAKGDWKLALDYYNRGIGQAQRHPYKGRWEAHPYVGDIMRYMESRIKGEKYGK